MQILQTEKDDTTQKKGQMEKRKQKQSRKTYNTQKQISKSEGSFNLHFFRPLI